MLEEALNTEYVDIAAGRVLICCTSNSREDPTRKGCIRNSQTRS